MAAAALVHVGQNDVCVFQSPATILTCCPSKRTHRIEPLHSGVPGIEAVTLMTDHVFGRHSHDQFGIGVMHTGAQRSWSGIGSVDAEAGDVIMVNPGEIHDGMPIGGTARGWRMLYFEPSLLSQVAEGVFEGVPEILRPAVRDPVLAVRFAGLFGSVTSADAGTLQTEVELLGVLAHAFMRHGRVRHRGPKQASPDVIRARRYLDAAPERPVTLKDLAGMVGVSRFQLIRGFARDVGTTPHAYLMQQRIRLAKRRLALGDGPAEAALRAGFADQSHMTRSFVRAFGLTPARYRSSFR